MLERQQQGEFGACLRYRDVQRAFRRDQLLFEQSKSLFADDTQQPAPPSSSPSSSHHTGAAAAASTAADDDRSSGGAAGSLRWLERECERVFGSAEMAPTVLGTLERTARGTDAEQQSALFDLMGESGFDLMGAVLQHRSRLLSEHLRSTLRRATAEGSGRQQALSQVSVTSQTQKQMRRLLRRETRRARRDTSGGISGGHADHQWLRSLQYEDSRRPSIASAAVSADRDRNVIIELFGEEVPELMARKTGQPLRRISHEGYEEFHLPAPERAEDTRHKHDPLLAIADSFPDWAQLAFRGFTHLNRVQSTVYERAFKSNENMLICAPTGCGKCWGRGTPFLMYDGTMKPVERIAPGDRLMGDDSTVRNVRSTTRGRGPMYRIDPHRDSPCASSFECNDDHILVLRLTDSISSSISINISGDGGSVDSGAPGTARHRIHASPCGYTATYLVYDEAENMVSERTGRFDYPTEAHPTQGSAMRAAQRFLSSQPQDRDLTAKDFLWQVPVKKFLTASAGVRQRCRMFMPERVIFAEREGFLRDRLSAVLGRAPTDEQVKDASWLLGMWLASSGIRAVDKNGVRVEGGQLLQEMRRVAQVLGCTVCVSENDDPARGGLHSTAISLPHTPAAASPVEADGNSPCTVSLLRGGGGDSFLSALLTQLAMLSDENRGTPPIPEDLLMDEIDCVRLPLLAGLIDMGEIQSPYSAEPSGRVPGSTYLLSHGCKDAASAICRLANLSGFRATTADLAASNSMHPFDNPGTRRRWSVAISGPRLSEVPCTAKRETALCVGDRYYSSHLMWGFDIHCIGEGDYYGFTVDGNQRMLLHDLTVTHNTNVALMAILHEVGQHFRGGKLHRDEFKMIYVAPMKALAQEMVQNFKKRLGPLGIVVREMTGDMQLTKREVQDTQLIVTTPEKWDVVTRKSYDSSLIQLVRLLIIDEVHLLNEDRGPVIECIVARTLRQVEASQSMIRIVGLSATLPNYEDVALFLHVNPRRGLFHFDNTYRPVPLEQRFIGVSERSHADQKRVYNEICYEKVANAFKNDQQIMIFVHSRNDTYKTARALVDIATIRGELDTFTKRERSRRALQAVKKSHNREMQELFQFGVGIHHAGMLRADRNLMEQMFLEGELRVLCCTATLAWGVNLPARTVVIKGTQVYDSNRGSFVELGMLDVMQIFGRAGRPQFDTLGEGIIITSYDQLPTYLRLLNHALPIESKLSESLENHLNAEVVLGTVTSMREALQWLSYTYLFVRMLANPMVYGIAYEELEHDQELGGHRRKLVELAARKLDECRMCRFNEDSGTISATDLGRVASHFYIHYETIQLFNEHLHPGMNEPEILDLVCRCKEFEQIKTREDELSELQTLRRDLPVKIKEGQEMTTAGKVNTLMQAYISNRRIKGFALVSDCAFVVQNMGRIVRALFELVLRKGWSSMVDKLLLLGKCIERRMWAFEHPLRQLPISADLVDRLERRNITLDALAHMDASELGDLVRSKPLAKLALDYVSQIPYIEMAATVQPITRTVLRVRLAISADFRWNKRFHGEVEPWWIWVEDHINEHIYHSEYFLLKHDEYDREQVVEFTIPIFEPIPTQYQVRAVSDRWIGVSAMCTISFKDLVLPRGITPHTDLLPLQPLPITALQNRDFERLYSDRISHFNPVQTQVFHTLYHTDSNVLLGAPTGSGKTLVAELAIMRLFREQPDAKVIYIAPLKALVRERIEEWRARFGRSHLGKKVVELTGDVTPDVHKLRQSDIVITTPEKWDGISRSWQQRDYVKSVGLIIMDEIHMLGQDRGPILEVIVSRMRYIGWKTGKSIRLVGLSTALANAKDLADWLGIHGSKGLFNFRPQVRPVPLQAHIQGFSGKNYCPRMATMNKPAYQAILTHGKNKPALVFVSSRRQTRLTAIDLIAYCAGDENAQQFLRMGEEELQQVLSQVNDSNLRHALSFGIGLHHAGLTSGDKYIVEHLFLAGKILVLVCTSTLAWGVNFPARLVVIKGTEFFDPKTRRYVDYPITDVLQMMGRAGRPGYDDKGVAVIMVEESKKDFYKKFLYEPFPVESSLHTQLHDHINAEIVAGTIASGQDAVDWLTWTFMFRRLIQNPTYYGVENPDTWDGLNRWLSTLVEGILDDLHRAGCIAFQTDDVTGKDRIVSSPLGFISSYYYLSHRSAARFMSGVTRDSSIEHLLQLLSQSEEYAELPVRHNEELLNRDLASVVRYGSFSDEYDSPHVKTFLLLQAHFSRLRLPIVDYVTDTKTVLDNTIRLIQAYVDMVAERCYLSCCLKLMAIMQMLMQGRWYDESSILTLPHMEEDTTVEEEDESSGGSGGSGGGALLRSLTSRGYVALPQLLEMDDRSFRALLVSCARRKFGGSGSGASMLQEVCAVKSRLPRIDVKLELYTATEQTTIRVNLTRLSKPPAAGQGSYTPRYLKTKDESFWVVIGDVQRDELLAMRRVGIRQRQSRTDLVVPTADASGRRLTVFLMTDCYLGLDQQYDFEL